MQCPIRPFIHFEMHWQNSGAAIIAGLLVFNAALAYFQESHAQATLTALKSRLALNASVRRDGIWKTVLAAELVRGDLVKLSVGSVVAADVHITEGSVLLDQSMLTGESLPIEVGPGMDTYAGALVRRGEATAEVTCGGAFSAAWRSWNKLSQPFSRRGRPTRRPLSGRPASKRFSKRSPAPVVASKKFNPAAPS